MLKQFQKQIKRKLGKCADSLQGSLDKQSTPSGNAPSPRETPVADPEVELLKRLFWEYPQLLHSGFVQINMRKEKLHDMAITAFRRNENCLQKNQRQNDFTRELHSNMLRDSGLLGVLNTMLQAAKQSEPIRWEVYRGYACRQLEQLEQTRNAPASPPEPISQLSAEELVTRIRRQMSLLSAQPLRTEYLPLYECLQKIPLAEPLEDLSVWYSEASAILAEGMARLEPELREALREDYPYL